MIFKIRFLIWVLMDSICGGYKYWKEDIYGVDLDDRYCCEGDMCMCGGVSVKEHMEWLMKGEW